MEWAQKFAMSKFATKEDRETAINAKIEQLAKKRDYAADVMGNVLLSATYQEDIDRLVAILPPNVQAEGAAHALSRSSLRAPGSASRDSEKGSREAP